MTQTERAINVLVNGKTHVLHQTTTLAGLMEALMPESDKTTATALNGDFIPRSQRSSTPLREGDHITCFQLIAGG